jgi:hypothetical protein
LLVVGGGGGGAAPKALCYKSTSTQSMVFHVMNKTRHKR